MTHSKSIEIAIEQLVVDGIALRPNQRPLLKLAIERELTRLLSDGEALDRTSGISVPRVAGGEITLAPASKHGIDTMALGRQIAGAIHAGIRAV